ncbi:MAG: glycosyltransferase family 2 protein [Acidimicrobiaceae bacterium]|nr:glycosyltransferase family 2 protein [Acidimicrobiaceae bacterium]
MTTTTGSGNIRQRSDEARLSDEAAAAFEQRYGSSGGAEVAVVIPALNEEESVATVVRNVPAEMCGLRTETIVVDDGSRDRTAEEASGAGALVCRVVENIGQGAAFRLGYRVARNRGARFIGTTDADGQWDPGELPALIEPLLRDEADVVNASRRLGRSYTTDSVRSAGVVLFGGLVSVLTGVRITDPANGMRAMRSEVTAELPLRQTQYQTSELLIRAIAHGYRVIEVPNTMYVRSAGESKKGSNLRYGYRFGRVVVTTWWAERATARRCVSEGSRLWRLAGLAPAREPLAVR